LLLDRLRDCAGWELRDTETRLLEQLLQLGAWQEQAPDAGLDLDGDQDLLREGLETLRSIRAGREVERSLVLDLTDRAERECRQLRVAAQATVHDDWEPHQRLEELTAELRAAADEHPLPSADEMRRILSRLASPAPADADPPGEELPDGGDGTARCVVPASTIRIEPPELGTIPDEELRDAYLQDAVRCTAAMEEAVLEYETQPGPASVRQICRELHTLKSASAIAGLVDVGRYLHDVEEFMQATRPPLPPERLVQVVLTCIETTRAQIQRLRGATSSSTATAARDAPQPGLGDPCAEPREPGDTDDSVCVQVSHLERLMDLLAALVMLRNQRGSRVEVLRDSHVSLARCAARLETVNAGASSPEAATGRAAAGGPSVGCDPTPPELVAQLTAIAGTLRESHRAVAEADLAVSRFIDRFRQELVQLLRTSVEGLFRRLQRAAADAARVEGKRVRCKIVGAQTGLERTTQEKLHEPLVHIVRNAVSHGIEDEATRIQAGKDPVGQITIEAHGTSRQITVIVRDDGQGLDFQALQQLGEQAGLLRGSAPTRQELAQLIFHPGLSTRERPNAIAGRGVGMDVVATALARMRGWVTVESEPGWGTTFTVTVPLRSMIEHVLIFRSGGQTFAVPMPWVRTAAPRPQVAGHVESAATAGRFAVPLTDLLGQVVPGRADGPWLVLSPSLPAEPAEPVPPAGETLPEVAVRVDEIVATEEVVVRPLPPLCRQQPLFSGLTLSGQGDVVLVLNPHPLLQRLEQARQRKAGAAL
jgi:chemotaxis protein histidine kinase CheA